MIKFLYMPKYETLRGSQDNLEIPEYNEPLIPALPPGEHSVSSLFISAKTGRHSSIAVIKECDNIDNIFEQAKNTLSGLPENLIRFIVKSTAVCSSNIPDNTIVTCNIYQKEAHLIDSTLNDRYVLWSDFNLNSFI